MNPSTKNEPLSPKDLPPPNLTAIVGGVVGLGAFTVSTIAGMASGAPAAGVIWRAVVAMTVGYGVGMLIGAAGAATVRDHIKRFKQERPIPAPQAEEHGANTAAEDQAQSRRGRAAA